jgi:hypothetical protein
MEGAWLQSHLLLYRMRRRALLDAHCSVLLPPLRAVAYIYMELTTTHEPSSGPRGWVRPREVWGTSCAAGCSPVAI